MEKTSFKDLPAQAKLEAMDKPYRPSRMPVLIGLIVALIAHAIFLIMWFNRDPLPVKFLKADAARGAPPVINEAGSTPGIFYQRLKTPIRVEEIPPAPPSPGKDAERK